MNNKLYKYNINFMIEIFESQKFIIHSPSPRKVSTV